MPVLQSNICHSPCSYIITSTPLNEAPCAMLTPLVINTNYGSPQKMRSLVTSLRHAWENWLSRGLPTPCLRKLIERSPPVTNYILIMEGSPLLYWSQQSETCKRSVQLSYGWNKADKRTVIRERYHCATKTATSNYQFQTLDCQRTKIL